MQVPSGKILLINASTNTSKIIEIPQTVYKTLLGGRGLGAFLAYKMLNFNIEPFSEKNPFIIIPGLLVGTGLSTASKTTIISRSPLTNLLGRSSVGARLGSVLRQLGLDALVIVGRARNPSVIVVDNEKVSIENAEEFWGLRISEARTELQKKYPGYSSCIIGPAGENLSRIALVDCDGRQAGRTGLGAVLGSKNIKAILAKARGSKSEYNREQRRLIVKWAQTIPKSPSSKTLVEYGTPIVVSLTEPQGVLPSRNWTNSTLSWCPDRNIARDEYTSYARRNRVARNPCISCNRPCSQVIRIRDPLENKIREYDGPEYELLYSLGTNLGFCDPENAAVLSLLADELGFDGISLGTTISWFLEAKEKGFIDLEKLPNEYKHVAWGNLEGIVKLITDIAYRNNAVASILAEGEKIASEKLGGPELAIHVKGLGLPAYDARGLKGLGLGYAVSSRGGDHLTSGMYAVELGGKLWIYDNVDPLTYRGKPHIVRFMENMFALFDILGICKFSRKEITLSDILEAVNVFTGYSYTTTDLMSVAERTITLERLVNLALGLSPREEDNLPRRLFEEPISDGPKKGERMDPGEFRRMKREYYLIRGWDPDTGVPTKEILYMLGLDKLLAIDIALVD
ncbi:MAG: aldehyde ferredoxin oxidoreductase family protein [Desulfurococcales archaeon]|nr:aldehyde ferredoxin oxidoreductase family protein [Desulfurococcales archaeon]